MCVVPMQFYSAYPTIAKANHGNSLPLAPTTRPELFPQSAEFANLPANGNGFDIGDLAYVRSTSVSKGTSAAPYFENLY